MDITKLWYVGIAIAVFQSVLAAVITGYINRQIKKREQRAKEDRERQICKVEALEKARLKREKIVLKVANASAKLSYAIVAAIQRGSPNGEIEEGMEAFEEAMEEQKEFMEEQALYHLKAPDYKDCK